MCGKLVKIVYHQRNKIKLKSFFFYFYGLDFPDHFHISFSGIWEYIENSRDMVRDLEQRTQNAKDNVDKMQGIMKTWVTSLFERKGDKPV